MSKILIVDDEADMRLSLKRLLERLGHDVTEAAEGPGALAIVAAGGIDLVLLDLRLPAMDGLEILKHIRSKDARLPVIMITGFGDPVLLEEAKRLGADKCLAKPFHNRDLAAAVAMILDAAKLRSSASKHERRLAQKIREPAAQAVAVSSRLPTNGWSRLSAGKKSFLVVVLAGACAALVAVADRRLSRTRAYPALSANQIAVTLVGDDLWVADWVQETLYEYTLTGGRLSEKRRHRLTSVHITAVAISADAIYIADSWRKVIEKRKLTPGLALISAVTSPGPAPSCLSWDGEVLWSCDARQGRIYAHDPQRMGVLSSMKAPVESPVAFYKSAGGFMMADATTSNIVSGKIDEQMTVTGIWRLPISKGPLAAVALDPKRVWYTYEREPTVYSSLLRTLASVR